MDTSFKSRFFNGSVTTYRKRWFGNFVLNDLRLIFFLLNLSYHNQFMGHWETCFSVIRFGKRSVDLLFVKYQYRFDFAEFNSVITRFLCTSCFQWMHALSLKISYFNQKQTTTNILFKSSSKKFHNIHRKTSVLESFLIGKIHKKKSVLGSHFNEAAGLYSTNWSKRL